jgi:hypothetical protein
MAFPSIIGIFSGTERGLSRALRILKLYAQAERRFCSVIRTSGDARVIDPEEICCRIFTFAGFAHHPYRLSQRLHSRLAQIDHR